MFEFSIGIIGFEWNRSKTVNVFINGQNVDAFSLDYGRDYSESEVMALALDYIAGLDGH